MEEAGEDFESQESPGGISIPGQHWVLTATQSPSTVEPAFAKLDLTHTTEEEPIRWVVMMQEVVQVRISLSLDRFMLSHGNTHTHTSLYFYRCEDLQKYGHSPLSP